MKRVMFEVWIHQEVTMKLQGRNSMRTCSTTPRRLLRRSALGAAAAMLALGLAGCGSGSDSSLTVAGDVPVAYVKRASSLDINPTDGAPSAPGGDLLLRDKSSASADEHNVTAKFTLGVGDASDPEVSYDGKKIVFALRCPTANNTSAAPVKDASGATVAPCTGRWNIWEYDMTGTTGLANGAFRRLTASAQDDDVDPAYLPGGGFVFASNRQAKSSQNQALGRTYKALDEYERETVLNLHTMDNTGANITQITFNQSHDRNPVVRANGEIMFSRWEHVGDRNRFAIFTVKPDGTNMFTFYGAQSPGNSFLHPREMDPNGPYNGYLSSSLMPLSRTQEGGALMFINAKDYSENNAPADKGIAALGGNGQSQITTETSAGRGLSLGGRVTSPYPLWDGTNRVLVAYHLCQVTRNGVVIPCASLTPAELAMLNDENMLASVAAAAPVQDNVPSAYGIYMFDPAKKTLLPVAAPPAGFMLTDPVAIQARAEPAVIPATTPDPTLGANEGLIEVRSVYDTDMLNRMAEPMLADADRPAGCSVGIAQTTPGDPLDPRTSVADIVKIKNPADPAYLCAPPRFVRATRAVAPPSSSMGLDSAIGETEFEMQQIVGYAQVEPDGSFKLKVPADVPLALAIIDSKGRAFQTHTNWIQVRPGEKRTCDGCHSPRRGAAMNTGAVVNSTPLATGLLAGWRNGHQLGETMASLRTRIDATVLDFKPDMVYSDVWADTTVATARPSISLRYTGNPNPADNLATPVPVNGIINYPEHVQPIWERDRGANTCTNCHNTIAKPDLRRSVSGTGRMVSYDELLIGDPVLVNGQPVVVIRDGVPEIELGAALVDSSSSSMSSAGITRKSRLGEIMFGETLLASAGARTLHPNPPNTAPNHALLLNAAEKRLISEWMDLGGQYYNDPFGTGSTVRSVTGVSQASFTATVHPILTSTCAAGCHQAGVPGSTVAAGTSFAQNRFVLTGSAEGDYNVTLAMINNACVPASNSLLSRPSTVHPAAGTTALLPVGSANYNTIRDWILTGCP
jgi:Hydrazine synthase alpha subunit middle domain